VKMYQHEGAVRFPVFFPALEVSEGLVHSLGLVDRSLLI
jgi:hypothetical protein